MGSIEEFVEKQPLEEKLDGWSIQTHYRQISRPPTYLLVDNDDKIVQTSAYKSAPRSNSVFEEEFESFCLDFTNDPKQKNKLEFFQKIKAQNITANVEDVQLSVENLVKSSADKKLRRVYGAFAPVVEALKDYTEVIDTMSKSSCESSNAIAHCLACYSSGLPDAPCVDLGWFKDRS